jgi:outer membrane protein assembly factor BamB
MMIGLSRLLGPAAVVALVALAGCAPPEARLPGQRFPVDLPLADSLPAEAGEKIALPAPENRSAPVRLPAAVANSSWTHRGGSATHLMPHLAFAAQPTLVWRASIGAPDRGAQRITAAPVADGGLIFTLDGAGRLTATRTDGTTAWTLDTRPQGPDRSDTLTGGGLAVASGRVFAATGAGELIAIDAASGTETWRQRFGAPLAGSPTVRDDTVFVQGRDATGWAVDVADGRLRWVIPGLPSTAAVAGSAAPAATAQTTIFALPGAMLAAARGADGAELWKSSVPGLRAGRAGALVRDITGDPVIDGARVYAGSSAGRTVALDLATGRPLWVAETGAMGPVWPAGGSVFLVSDVNQLVRLDAATGAQIWAVALPGFVPDSQWRVGMDANYGPVLAGGRLIVVSSDGALRMFDPTDGRLLDQIALGAGAAGAPALANGTLYVVTQRGELLAFR